MNRRRILGGIVALFVAPKEVIRKAARSDWGPSPFVDWNRQITVEDIRFHDLQKILHDIQHGNAGIICIFRSMVQGNTMLHFLSFAAGFLACLALTIRIHSGALWLLRDKISLAAFRATGWDRPVYFLSENGGRRSSECLDVNAGIGRIHLSCTIWGLGRLAWLTRWIPAPSHGGGYHLPKG